MTNINLWIIHVDIFTLEYFIIAFQIGTNGTGTCARLSVPNSHPLAMAEANQFVMTALFDLELGVCLLALLLRHY